MATLRLRRRRQGTQLQMQDISKSRKYNNGLGSKTRQTKEKYNRVINTPSLWRQKMARNKNGETQNEIQSVLNLSYF